MHEYVIDTERLILRPLCDKDRLQICILQYEKAMTEL